MRTTYRKLLVVDDLLAIEGGAPGQPSRHSFLRDVGGEPEEFEFCTAWDEVLGRYSTRVALDFILQSITEASLLLLDVRFESTNPSVRGTDLGRALLPLVREEFPGLPVVMMTTEKPEDSGREFLRLGAVDYLIKPLEKTRFWRTVRRYVAQEPSERLLGQNDLYQGAVHAAAVLAEVGHHLIIQGDSAQERAAFAGYAARCAGRSHILSLDVRGLSEETLATQLVGRRLRAWEREVTPSSESLLAEARGGVLQLIAVDALPRGLQAVLARFLASQPSDKNSVLVVGETSGGLSRLAQEDRFDRDLFDLLNGSQPVNIPRVEMVGEDVLLRLSAAFGSVTESGTAYDRQDEAAFTSALNRVSIAGFDRWYSKVVQCCAGQPGRPLRECIAPTLDEAPEMSKALPLFPESVVENGAREIIFDIRRRELGLLVSAYTHARGNRARAAMMLRGTKQGRVSTVHFDRWFQQVWKEFTLEQQNEMRSNTDVCEICRALALDE